VFTFASTPFPSTIDVTGLPPITDVNVNVQLDSQELDDVGLLLVGPSSQQSYLLSDAGGTDDVTGLNITFDDEAAGPPTDTTVITSGSYQPFNYAGIETFPAPAPVINGSTVLSVFDGLSPNGQWRLYADDDNTDNLTVVKSWSLDFTWADNLVPTGTVNINGGAASTTSPNVTLNLSASDPAPATGVVQMRFSNDGVTFSPYQAYATTAAWTLSAGDGTKTVYAQFRDGDGNQSAVASDAIALDATGPKAKKLTPKKNAKGVKTTTKVKIKANEALNKSTVTKKNVFLKKKGDSTKIKAKVTYNASKNLIVLTPVDDLKSGKTYKVTVKNVQDAFGHKWDEKPNKSGSQALKFSFTTA
jgi:subtilisin-like proprotein convertase family protein